jgi:hypothetical protein
LSAQRGNLNIATAHFDEPQLLELLNLAAPTVANCGARRDGPEQPRLFRAELSKQTSHINLPSSANYKNKSAGKFKGSDEKISREFKPWEVRADGMTNKRSANGHPRACRVRTWTDG